MVNDNEEQYLRGFEGSQALPAVPAGGVVSERG
jgi:hypothetical protein